MSTEPKANGEQQKQQNKQQQEQPKQEQEENTSSSTSSNGNKNQQDKKSKASSSKQQQQQKYTVVSVDSRWLGIAVAAGAGLMFYSSVLGGSGSGGRKEISFQRFKTEYLERGLVSKVCYANNSLLH